MCVVPKVGVVLWLSQRLIFVWDHRLMIVTIEALVSETLRALAVIALQEKWKQLTYVLIS